MKKVGLFLIALSVFVGSADESPHLGDTLPNFTLKDPHGEVHILHEYRNKTVILFTLGYG